MDEQPLDRSSEKGKPFLIPAETGEPVKAYYSQPLPDFAPTLEINGSKMVLGEQLAWYDFLLGAIPVLLLFVGVAIGGGVGAGAMLLNFNILRQHGSRLLKYLKVLGVIAISGLLYLLFAGIVHFLFPGSAPKPD